MNLSNEINKLRPGSISRVLLTFSIAVLALNMNAQAPKPPVPVEFMFGHEKLYFQLMLKKSFTPESKFGFFMVTTYTARYDDFSDVNITLPMHIYYNFWKGFSVFGGASMNSVTGFSPNTGFSHNFASQKVLAVTDASFSINSDYDFNLFGIYSYKPPINDKWAFYSRLQLLYNTSLKEGSHNRSYVYLRAGLKRQSLIFGLGANLDQFGPDKHFEDNYGVFIGYELK